MVLMAVFGATPLLLVGDDDLLGEGAVLPVVGLDCRGDTTVELTDTGVGVLPTAGVVKGDDGRLDTIGRGKPALGVATLDPAPPKPDVAGGDVFPWGVEEDVLLATLAGTVLDLGDNAPLPFETSSGLVSPPLDPFGLSEGCCLKLV